MTTDPSNEMLPILDRLGAFDPADRVEVPGTRPDRAEPARTEEELTLGLASLAPGAEPPQGLFAAIEAEIDALPQAHIETLRADEGEWTKRYDKVWKKVLSVDKKSGRSIYLLRCEPDAVIPAHAHDHLEQAFVIEGELRVGGSLLKAGDFQIARPGSIHPEIRTPTGCLILVHV